MTVKITVVGLGQIGTSIGLALADETSQILRIGHDPDLYRNTQAKKIGAFEDTHLQLFKAIDNAEVIILALPFDQVYETLKVIAPELKPETVILDTSPLQVQNIAWAKELLPPEVYFLTFTPSLNPDLLEEIDNDPEKARADLFKRGMFFITAPSNTSEDAYNLASNLSALLGAAPFFADAWETDGLSAAVHTLPKFTSAALIHATINQPGWQEAQKLAGAAYAQSTKAALNLDEDEAYGKTALANRENMVRVLDNLISELHRIRQSISENDADAVKNFLTQAKDNRLFWQQEREKANWSTEKKPEVPTSGDFIGQLFGIRKRKKKE